MKRKIIIISILIICIICLSSSISYGNNIPNEEYINKFFIDINVLNGYPDGELRLNNTITREEFSKIIVLASTFKDKLNLFSQSSVFSDVEKGRWSSPYIKIAAENGILQGYPDFTFKPTNNIKLEEACVIALRLLNYTSNDYGVSWPYSQVSFAKKEHILDNVNKNAGENITRKDAINIIYNILCSQINGQNVKYINMLDYTIIDNVYIIASNNQDNQILTSNVLTSNGLYRLSNSFDNTTIGSNSTIVLNKSNEIVSIIPYNQNEEIYTIASIIKNGIIVLENNGSTKNIEINDDITAYYKSSKTTADNVSSLVSTGDIVHIFYKNNQIEYILLEKTQYKGPFIVANNDWISNYSIPSNVEVIRNNKIVDSNEVEINDVLYYYPDTNQVEVFNVKVSGIIENISPNIKNASRITINNNTYTIGTESVYKDIQEYSVGKAITLLLGKDNVIAGISNSQELKLNEIGILLEMGTKEITENTSIYTKYTAKVLLTNGNINEYIVDKNYNGIVNKIVKVNYSSSGKINLIEAGIKNNIYGLIDCNKYKIGNVSISRNINIIEIPQNDGNYVPVTKKIYIERLDNVYIGSSNVIYYTKNDNGEIDNLIITEVTNDMYSCGILLSAIETSPFSSQTIYTVNLNNKDIIFNSPVRYNIDINKPIQFLLYNNQIIDINKLTKINVNDIASNKIINGKDEYTLSSDIPVYIKNNTNEYLITNLQFVIDNKEEYSIVAYYDKLEKSGGKIRALIIQN